MRRKRSGWNWRFWVVVGVLAAGLALANAMDASAQQPSGKELITVNFQDTDLRVVIRFISELTGKNFIVDSKVKGRVTVISPTKITIEEAYRMFESILEVEGYTTVPAGRIIKIIPARDAKSRGIDTIPDREKRVLRGEQFVTRIIHLDYIDAASVTPIIKPLVSKESSLVTYTYTNDIILTDTIPNVQKILDILSELDVEGFQVEITVLPLEFANATDLAAEILSIFEVKAAPTAPERRRKRQPAVTGVGPQRVVKIIPDERTNSLIVLASGDDTRQVEELVTSLDVPPPKGKGRINVIYLKNADAEELAQTLQEITAPGKKTAAAAPGQKPVELAGEVAIVPDKATNSLVITASPQDFEVLKDVIEQLDIRRLQVFVEGLIMEISADRFRELALQFRFAPEDLATDATQADTEVFGGTVFGGVPQDPFATEGLVLGVAKGTITFGGVSFLNISALIAAVESDSEANILSTPHLLTTDNEEAELVVAENVPFRVRTTATASGFPVEEIERRDVGVTLRITPQISEGDFLKLNIYQETSQVQPAGTVEGASDLTTLKRSTKTTVVVKDGQTVVISGLIAENILDSVSKVPWLGDIPVLGHLFRATARTKRKNNLVIIITPHIIRTSRDLEDVYKQKREEVEEFERKSRLKTEKGMGMPTHLLKARPEDLIKDEGIRR
ncbi:MAG: type II secretion system secretin GspD [Proteobacteria bacterium]|nr:type II secretion system secretin GspD [Pseudomonadota bacterium]